MFFSVKAGFLIKSGFLDMFFFQAKPQKWNFVDSAPEETELEKSTDQKKLEVPKM